MKIAISTDNNMVSPHFGRCPQFTIVDIEDDKVKNRTTINNPGHHPGYLPQFLSEAGVNCIVAGGMGSRAEELFKQAGIDTILGVKGEIPVVIDKLAAGTLNGGQSICGPGAGKGYGIDKTECEHEEE
ncbi:MAG: NifB/NifX family molybdenum-iron cluster-binding protein [Actinomycetota bacterium]|nr:NifB/NifX family molybdenum-iron cluster-binding protein [Actinomycetota bacterium]